MIEEILKKRTNITFFREDKIPDKEVIEDMSSQEIGYVLENYSKYLTYDLKRNFEEKREKDLKESPFDAIINEDLGINTKEL